MTKTVHHEPVQRNIVKEMELLLLLTVIKSRNQCRICRPVNDQAFIDSGNGNGKVQSCQLGKRCCQLLGSFLCACIFNGIFSYVISSKNGIKYFGLSVLSFGLSCRFRRLCCRFCYRLCYRFGNRRTHGRFRCNCCCGFCA